MIGNIEAAIERVRGATSGGVTSSGGRRVLGIVVVLLLVGLSGYLAAASGVTVDFSVGADDDRTVSGAVSTIERGGDGAAEEEAASEVDADAGSDSAAVAGADLPQGFVGSEGGAQDADGDGIDDAAEAQVHGTDPTVRDTDGDGIPDGRELACSAAYPDADPLQQDVYIELDSVDGVALSNASKKQLRTAFADGPVANPNGDDGIALHLVESDDALPEEDSVNDDRRSGAYNDVGDYRSEHFQYQDAGYYYLLVSTDVAYNGKDKYAGAGRPGTAIVEHYDRDGVMSSLVMHELGHSFGLGRSKEGVDTRTYSRDGYASVMNYNILYETLTYSTGDDDVGRNEWEYVAEARHVPETNVEGDSFCPTVG